MNIKLDGCTYSYSFNLPLTLQEALDRLHQQPTVTMEQAKVYRVIDDATCVLTTTDELKALRRYHEIMDANDKINTWGWIDTEDLT